MKRFHLRPICLAAVAWLLLSIQAYGSISWLPFGPDGGDARSFAVDPKDRTHLYLGTVNGWIYDSHDGGEHWTRLARLDDRDDLVLDHVLVDSADPRHLLVGVWVLGGVDGGLYVSRDAGRSWHKPDSLKGQSIRALTASSARPGTYVAGTLDGVFRSEDGGESWRQISPKGSKELHEVESIAIDPGDPRVIYAGTWHLPWKTTDGGENWTNIKEGIIEDSDVFSMIVDPKQSSVVYASACSGIYKSENGGEQFKKIQGIPSTARRTRVLMQDPLQLNRVFAGTTEGLFRTDDAGETWTRTTGPELVVNDVFVDPADSQHVLLATDHGGVLASHDGGTSFSPSNSGFSARQITSFLADRERPGVLYVGVVNDKEWGGAFVSENGGLTWVQVSTGLGGRDVFSLGQTLDGTVLAGTGHGIFRLKDGIWAGVGGIDLNAAGSAGGPVRSHAPSPSQGTQKRVKHTVAAKPVTYVQRGALPGGRAAPRQPKANASSGARKRPASRKSATRAGAAKTSFDGLVSGFATTGNAIYAASSAGLLVSSDGGDTWHLAPDLPAAEWRQVSAMTQEVLVASLSGLEWSGDRGQQWKQISMPSGLTGIGAAALDDQGGIWVGGREGLFVSTDHGEHWETVPNLYVRDINSINFDAANQRMLLTANQTTKLAFGIHLPDRRLQFWESGWHLRMARAVGDHLLGVTLFDGVVVQPRMVESSEIARP